MGAARHHCRSRGRPRDRSIRVNGAKRSFTMIANAATRAVRAGLLAFALVAIVSPVQAQQQPSSNAIALAKEIIALKGGNTIYEPVVPQIIDRARTIFLQSNPMLSAPLNEVAAQLRPEMASRVADLINDGAKLYASRFTEQELKDVLAFYKSPIGRKVVAQEPVILDESATNIETWANKFAEEVINKFRAEMRKKGHEI